MQSLTLFLIRAKQRVNEITKVYCTNILRCKKAACGGASAKTEKPLGCIAGSVHFEKFDRCTTICFAWRRGTAGVKKNEMTGSWIKCPGANDGGSAELRE